MIPLETVANNLIQSFEDVTFIEQGHRYPHKRLGDLPSVSKKLTKFYTPFDRKVAFFVARRDNRTTEEVLAEWDKKRDDACDLGTRVHKFAEGYMTGCLKPSCDMEFGVVQFLKDLPEYIVPVVYELPVFSETYVYAGTPDLLLYNQLTGRLIIGDWKTNESLFKNYRNKKLLNPFSDLLDNQYNKYRLQLSHYEICLLQAGYEVEDRWLIWLRPDETNMKFYKLFQMESSVKELQNHYGYDDWKHN